MEKQRKKEETQKKLLEQRATYLEKTKNMLVFDEMAQEKPRKSGGRVCLYLARKLLQN